MRIYTKQNKIYIYLLIFICAASTGFAKKEDPGKVVKVAEQLYCISGYGGNIAVAVAADGLLVVDSGLPNTAAMVLGNIKKISALPISKLINTHYHSDHTGGNVVNPYVGKSAEQICHVGCLKSLKRRLKPEELKAASLPAVTYEDTLMIKVGEDTVKLIHFGPGHTAGDSVVIFEGKKTIHTGDLFFNGMAPYIDVKDGSDTGNWVRTIRKLAADYPDYTVIPGHGPVTDMAAFVKFADYLTYLREQVSLAIKQGKSMSQAQDTIDMSAFKHIKEHNQFMTKKANVGWIYEEMEKSADD